MVGPTRPSFPAATVPLKTDLSVYTHAKRSDRHIKDPAVHKIKITQHAAVKVQSLHHVEAVGHYTKEELEKKADSG